MGVTGLWTVVQPCARPVKIDTLNKKRLAIDASIWIYQFLKAVRDKEGNALRNSHVVGFFRRICKLLFFGIKPVFVFDGGAPALKRQTIAARKQRREGRREDAARTAGKLLAVQMQRRAEEEEAKRREAEGRKRGGQAEEEVPDNPVYVDQIYQTPQERQTKKFRKTDQYHLPELETSLAEMGGPDDPRVMSLEELHEYARQFNSGEDVNLYDFSKIDFDGPFFQSLPASDRYNILNAARLRSRLRMGYSKEQLDTMFPDRMAFSKFQVERVRERNELTQRLMHINGMNESGMFGVNGVNRVAGEKGREYVLVKNEGVEGGWVLGVVTNDEGKYDKPINVDLPPPPEDEESEGQDDDDFEDVPIPGLNRLPKQHEPDRFDQLAAARDLAAKRKDLYNSRASENSNRTVSKKSKEDNTDSLFVADEADEWDDVRMTNQVDEEEEEDLQRAIAMSLEKETAGEGLDDDDYMEVFHQSRAEEPKPFSQGSGLAIAHVANNRSRKAAPNPFAATSDSEDEGMDLSKALAESRRSKRKTSPVRPRSPNAKSRSRPQTKLHDDSVDEVQAAAKAQGFDGPLPFEKLDLGPSLLGKKKTQDEAAKDSGGFMQPGDEEDEKRGKEEPPLPPWFVRSTDAQNVEPKTRTVEDDLPARRRATDDMFVFEERADAQRQRSPEIIDVEKRDPAPEAVIAIDSEDEIPKPPATDKTAESPNARMGDIADAVRAAPPPTTTQKPKPFSPNEQAQESPDEVLEWEESDHEGLQESGSKRATPLENQRKPSASPEFEDVPVEAPAPKSPTPEFEDVPIAEQPPQTPEDLPGEPIDEDESVPIPADDQLVPPEEDMFSDPEEEELMAQMAAEVEEHARFTSTLNQKSAAKEAFDHERELKSLRVQQRKDLRDADEVTSTMISECQHLLSLFGLPYITAPMEAEAQCAELVHLGLVDGIVTDDSDIFLFGGTRVYKNMFNQAKFVECYLASDLSDEFGLTRENLISCAELLGSDYTTGLPGVGPVTAVELLGEFGDLASFVTWFTAVQRGEIPPAADKPHPVRRKFRRAHGTKLFLPPGFPDARVRDAYLQPQTDANPESFRWGVPDLEALRRFLSSTVGWSEERTDEVLVPVVRDMNRREQEGTQANITRFFEGSVGAGAFAPRKRDEVGARLGNALGRMRAREKRQDGGGSGDGDEEEDVEGAEPANPPSQRSGGKLAKRKEASVELSDGDEDADIEYEEPKKKARKGGKGASKGGSKRGRSTA